MTQPFVMVRSSCGVRRKTAWGVPAAAQMVAWSQRSSSMNTTMGSLWPTGGTPPMAKPLARRTLVAQARRGRF